MKLNRRHRRSSKGFSFAEVAATAFLAVVLLMIGVDVTLLIFAATVNDSACRNACRAAAQGSDFTKATALANAALRSHRTDGFFISQPTITHFEYQTFGGSPPADETPFVQVRTEVTVRLPVPIFFFGATFNDNNDLVFQQLYSYPIIKTKILMP